MWLAVAVIEATLQVHPALCPSGCQRIGHGEASQATVNDGLLGMLSS